MKITKQFKVGDKVRWISSNTRKVGEIIAIVPKGKMPREIGYPKAGGGGWGRDHESYVVQGAAVPSRHQAKAPRKAHYWPVVSLLEADESET